MTEFLDRLMASGNVILTCRYFEARTAKQLMPLATNPFGDRAEGCLETYATIASERPFEISFQNYHSAFDRGLRLTNKPMFNFRTKPPTKTICLWSRVSG